MDMPEFSRRLRERLCIPGIYSGGSQLEAGPFSLLLWHGNYVMGRYALAVWPWSRVENPARLLIGARQAIRKQFFTIPFLAQVGLYLIVCGQSAEWSRVVEGVDADQTSLHAVIIQGIHFLDLNTGHSVVKRSQWGSIRFGGTTSVEEAVNSVLQ